MIKSNPWFVYLIRDKNSSLYCGVTDHVIRRFRQHQSGKGAKFLRGKAPLTLEWLYIVDSKSTAMKLEYKIKRLPKSQKERMILTQRLPTSLEILPALP
ncbi:GIY-YIG nuclease family protein [Vibrio nigripulchritudo]|uniref:GIY-YIG nuclease family protein n=1 Tax=Vibrio nigripulchritudo TaxID=28173 RepID=UPI0003B1B496|nr:GIY-YIG nuclease family protein [Vibrio nigripulchritudo]CCN73717.1 putative Excinuclease ABC, C subunit [Vibrio nigripulchritudo SFn118]